MHPNAESFEPLPSRQARYPDYRLRKQTRRHKGCIRAYYDTTWLQGNYNPSNIYEYKNDIERRKLFTQNDIDKVVTLLLCGDEQQIAGIPSILGQLVNEYVKPLPEEEQELIRKEVTVTSASTDCLLS